MVGWFFGCVVFKEHPRSPPARCAFRESASIVLPHPFRLCQELFEFIFASSQDVRVRLPAAFALVAVRRRLVIYYTVDCSLSMAFYKVFPLLSLVPGIRFIGANYD